MLQTEAAAVTSDTVLENAAAELNIPGLDAAKLRDDLPERRRIGIAYGLCPRASGEAGQQPGHG